MRALRLLAAISVLSAAPAAGACEACRPAVDALIHGPDFWTNVGVALLPFAVIAAVVVLVEQLSAR